VEIKLKATLISTSIIWNYILKKVNSCVNARCSLWVTYSTCYQTLIQLMLHVNSWKVVKIMTKKYYHFCKDSKVEIFSISIFSHYYKIQHGGKNLMLVNKVVIVFTMEIMHKKLINNFTCYLYMMIINQIVVMEKPKISSCDMFKF